ncbi:melanophilin isoform X2 [Cololabis saira]|uniref:melanophilin isoform X2 n=1 Tax=Cololabis saira TaxID=129043 RepID=UPI002AD4C539|nr:melanophilin isoform X2 [Cololabis saira]
MMPSTAAQKKLDLSKLTDEEAQHVWKVVQRDFDLRKKEEDRLGELKTKIEKEDIKKELLGNQTSLTASHCIGCLQAFKFLVNIKRQCLDCQLYICKSCSHYSKKELGWVCDPCHMTRVLKVGTLEWYHDNVRARFKRFGSAKVLRSLFKRLSGEHLSDDHDFDIQSMPEVHNGYEEHFMDTADSQQYKAMKKTKRRLTVDPYDVILGCENSSNSRGQTDQDQGDCDLMDVDTGTMESGIAESDMAAAFHQIEVQHKDVDVEKSSQHDDYVYTENRATSSRSISRLSYSSCGSAVGPRDCNSYLPGLDDSEGEDSCQQYPIYQSHPGPCSHTSLESLNSAIAPPQISDLNRRMSAIENLLNRLEQKVTSAKRQAPTLHTTYSPPQWEEVDMEELQLREQLHRMTDNISDHSLTSDDDADHRPQSCQDIPEWRGPQEDPGPFRIPTRPTSRDSNVSSRVGEIYNSSESLERKDLPLQQTLMAGFKGSTALLVELEDKVAQAAASVQSAQSEVTYIENRIAALNAAGNSVDKRKKSAIPIQTRRLSHNFPTSNSWHYFP